MHWQTRTHQVESEKIGTCRGLNPGPLANSSINILTLSHTGSHGRLEQTRLVKMSHGHLK